MKSFISTNIAKILWIISALCAVLFISIVLYDIYGDSPYGSNRSFTLYDKLVIALCIGYFIFFLLSLFLWRNCHYFYYGTDTLQKTIKKSYIIPSCVLVIMLAAAVLMEYCPGNGSYNLGENFLINLGGLFAIFLGIVTVLGTFLALKSIVEQEQIITSYSQLYKHVTELLNNVKSDDEIKIVSYFILPGYWQVTNKRRRKKFKEALEKVIDQSNVKVISLNKKEHLSVLIDMVNKGTPMYPITENNRSNYEEKAQYVNAFQKECYNLLNKANDNFRPLCWNQLPGYFFIITDQKAIIVTPVGLPEIKPEIVDKISDTMNIQTTVIQTLDTVDMRGNRNTGKRTVETLGFETSDPHVIDELNEIFDKLYDPTQNLQTETSMNTPNNSNTEDIMLKIFTQINTFMNNGSKIDVEVEIFNNMRIKVKKEN
ncbi:MAG: hypothetical protein LBL74_00450 [Bacteroidales bacterium]|jgi:hypothetical protein|nr:hypothetical protein [Bacteroidales bacterium]